MRVSQRLKAAQELLTGLLRFANGGPLEFPQWMQATDLMRVVTQYKAYFDNKGRQPYYTTALRSELTALLTPLAVTNGDGLQQVEALINQREIPIALISGGPGRTLTSTGRILRGDDSGPAMLLPAPRGPVDVLYAVLALARITATETGDALLDRISRCEHCGNFWILPTRKPSRFCSKKCRDDYRNHRRKIKRASSRRRTTRS